MRKINYFRFVAILGLMAIVASCTMEKRHYSAGYYIDWKKNTAAKSEARQNNEVAQAATIKSESVQAPASRSENTVQAPAPVYSASTSDAPVLIENTAASQAAAAKSVKEVKSKMSARDMVKAAKMMHAIKKEIKHASNSSKKDDTPLGLLYVLCILIPFVAVGLVTDWDGKTVLINILWCLLCGIPGIIHAFIVVNRERG